MVAEAVLRLSQQGQRRFLHALLTGQQKQQFAEVAGQLSSIGLWQQGEGIPFAPVVALADLITREHLSRLEKTCRKKLGDPKNPLLVSVRSGAARSMPGMMETILNLGLNDHSVVGLANVTNNPRFAWDSYRRFIQMYSTVVVGLPKDVLEGKLHTLKHGLGVHSDTDIPADMLRQLCGEFKAGHDKWAIPR